MHEERGQTPTRDYLVTTKLHDKPVPRWVTAVNAQTALRSLKEQGCQDIVFYTDDLSEQVPTIGERQRPSAKVWLYNSTLAQRSFIYRATVKAIPHVVMLCILAVLIGINTFFNPTKSSLIITGMLLIAFIAPTVSDIIKWLTSPNPARVFDKAQRAMLDCEWQRALELFSSIDSVVAESGNPSYIGTTALWKAVASAKTGDTAQAEQLLSMYDTDDRFPDWYALLKRAEYCVFFHEFEAAKELLTESLAVAPNEPSVQLTYVELLATHFPHLHAEARATLSGFHRESSTELTSLFLDGLDGVVRLNEQQNQAARDELQGVVNNLTPLVRASPLLMATICKFQAFLVIAQARCVEADAAQRLYSQIKQFLVAHEMNDLVDRVEQELALTS